MPELKPKPERSWLIVVLVFLGFWITYLAVFLPSNHTPQLKRLKSPKPAKYDWLLDDMKEQTFDFMQFRGKTVFLNVWATWCPPCVGEMPSIAQLADRAELKAKNIEFVCVSVDESAQTVRDYVAKKGWPMTVLHTDALPAAYQTEGIPATFILSPEGRIVAAEVGASDWNRPDVVSFLLDLASESPAATSGHSG